MADTDTNTNRPDTDPTTIPATDIPTSNVKWAGKALRRYREERGLTQRDVERRTGGKIIAQQLSRLEKGAIGKPPMEDLAVLGTVYGFTPTDMAQLYGYVPPAPALEASELSSARGRVKLEAERLSGEIERSMAEPSTGYVPWEGRLRAAQEPRQAAERLPPPGWHPSDWQHPQPSDQHLQQLQALSEQLPEHLRAKLYHWLDLITVLLTDELRASGDQ